MDFSKFTIFREYTKNFIKYELFFDFDLKEITGHNKKTFDGYKGLLFYLENNPGRKIYLTLTKIQESFESGEKIVINIKSYQDFWRQIGQNSANRVQAFLAKKIKHYSEEERKEVIASASDEDVARRIESFSDKQKEEIIINNATEVNILDAIKKFSPDVQYNLLKSLRELTGNGDSILITDSNKKQIFEQILRQNYSEDFWNSLRQLNPEIADKLSAAHRQKHYQEEMNNLEQLLKLEENDNIVMEIKNYENLKQYVAGQPEKIFQNWIEKNLWVFGIEYIKKLDARQIAFFSEADLLMESVDSFLDLIELKRPKLEYKLFSYDEGHKSYYPSSNLSSVIGQCLFYLQKMDEYKLNLENEYKVKVLRPRIKIIAGRTKDFDSDQFNAMRMLNSNLNHIQIYSYDYILSCGKKIISLYEN